MYELLLQRARNGDSNAFEALVAPFEKHLWQICWHYNRNMQDA